MVADHVDRVKRDSRLSIDLLRTPPVVNFEFLAIWRPSFLVRYPRSSEVWKRKAHVRVLYTVVHRRGIGVSVWKSVI